VSGRGAVPDALAGSRTAVFTATIWDDYAALHHGGPLNGVDPIGLTT